MNPWDCKTIHGAERLACAECGAHVLALPGRAAACSCCGGLDLHSVTAVDRRRSGRRRFGRVVHLAVVER